MHVIPQFYNFWNSLKEKVAFKSRYKASIDNINLRFQEL